VAKQNGLSAKFLVGGYDISGDVSALDSIKADDAQLDVTDITLSAHARIPGLRDGSMGFTTFFDPAGAHPVLAALPTADELMTFLVPPLSLGSPAACLNAKQVNYDPTRGTDGSLLVKVAGNGNGYGLEWARQVTPGLRTDTAATTGADLDNGGPSYWGAQMYLQVTSFTGTDMTVSVQHSADNSTYYTLGSFTTVSSAPNAQRITTPAAQTFTATNGTPAIFTVPGSAYANGTAVALSGASLPTGFSASTVYYVVSSSGSTFELSATHGGSAINSSSTGSGTVTPAVLRYLEVVTTTVSGFNPATFAVAVNRNLTATVFLWLLPGITSSAARERRRSARVTAATAMAAGRRSVTRRRRSGGWRRRGSASLRSPTRR
jgi:hypothetical protein